MKAVLLDAGLTLLRAEPSLGGVYSGEHGTGKRKRKDFLQCYGAEAAAQVRRAKAAIDPQFLLNRGNLCAAEPIDNEARKP